MLLGLELHGDGLLDLAVLELHGRVLQVTVGVVLAEDLQRLLVPVLCNQVTGRLGDEPDEGKLDDGREGLKKGGDSPGPVIEEIVRAEGEPGHEEGADIPKTVVDSGQAGSVLGVAELSEEHGRRQLRKGVAEAEQEAAAHKDRKMTSCTLHDGARNHDDTADDDWYLSSKVVGEEGDDSDGGHTANLVESTEKTQHGTLGVAKSLERLTQRTLV